MKDGASIEIGPAEKEKFMATLTKDVEVRSLAVTLSFALSCIKTAILGYF